MKSREDYVYILDISRNLRLIQAIDTNLNLVNIKLKTQDDVPLQIGQCISIGKVKNEIACSINRLSELKQSEQSKKTISVLEEKICQIIMDALSDRPSPLRRNLLLFFSYASIAELRVIGVSEPFRSAFITARQERAEHKKNLPIFKDFRCLSKAVSQETLRKKKKNFLENDRGQLKSLERRKSLHGKTPDEVRNYFYKKLSERIIDELKWFEPPLIMKFLYDNSS